MTRLDSTLRDRIACMVSGSSVRGAPSLLSECERTRRVGPHDDFTVDVHDLEANKIRVECHELTHPSIENVSAGGPVQVGRVGDLLDHE